ncbi:DUF1857-domain-containing protein [Jackrogersella minutella]|nr:DUF1857-domain-containing protein [Jackrogersella minutella]
MITINIAYTAPVNPSSATPVLTQAQVWAGLQRKVRRAQDFVPIIEDCTVVSEETVPGTDNVKVTRDVQFAAGSQPADVTLNTLVREVCTSFPPCRVDFLQPKNGNTISNILSKDGHGDLIMTYSFEWRYSSVKPGSEEAKVLEERCWHTAKIAVLGTIDTIRRLVRDGEIMA